MRLRGRDMIICCTRYTVRYCDKPVMIVTILLYCQVPKHVITPLQNQCMFIFSTILQRLYSNQTICVGSIKDECVIKLVFCLAYENLLHFSQLISLQCHFQLIYLRYLTTNLRTCQTRKFNTPPPIPPP